MNKKNYILNNASTKYFEYFFLKKLAGTQPEPTPAVEGEGTNFTLTTGVNKTIDVLKCKGSIVQNGEPSPDNPIDVQVVTGTQTLTITNGTNIQTYTLTLGSLELCKIADYQDYIYKDGDDWYVHKEFGKVNFNDLTWSVTVGTILGTTDIPNIKYVDSNQKIGVALAQKYIVRQGSGLSNYINYLAVDKTKVNVNTGSTQVNPTGIFYYELENYTNTKITDATLISNLDTILSTGYLKKGTNTISVTSTGTNLPSIIYIKSN